MHRTQCICQTCLSAIFLCTVRCKVTPHNIEIRYSSPMYGHDIILPRVHCSMAENRQRRASFRQGTRVDGVGSRAVKTSIAAQTLHRIGLSIVMVAVLHVCEWKKKKRRSRRSPKSMPTSDIPALPRESGSTSSTHQRRSHELVRTLDIYVSISSK